MLVCPFQRRLIRVTCPPFIPPQYRRCTNFFSTQPVCHFPFVTTTISESQKHNFSQGLFCTMLSWEWWTSTDRTRRATQTHIGSKKWSATRLQVSFICFLSTFSFSLVSYTFCLNLHFETDLAGSEKDIETQEHDDRVFKAAQGKKNYADILFIEFFYSPTPLRWLPVEKCFCNCFGLSRLYFSGRKCVFFLRLVLPRWDLCSIILRQFLSLSWSGLNWIRWS